MGICDYLSEIRRSFWANPLTLNTLFTVWPRWHATMGCRISKMARVVAIPLMWMGVFAGCTSPELPKPAPVAPVAIAVAAKPTALSAEAEAALKAAEKSVIDARAKKSVWTAAVAHLDQARAAAKVFDSDATLEHAKEVVALCALSIQQTLLPPVKW